MHGLDIRQAKSPLSLVGTAVRGLDRRMEPFRPPASAGVEPSMDDLMAQVATERDRAAFGRLFAHFAPRLKAYLQRQGATGSTAEDLVQEVMLTVWRRAHLFDRRRAGVSTWIYTIARNKRIDALRRERRPEIDPHDPALVGADAPDPDEGIDLAQQGARLHAAIGVLPPEQVHLLRLSFFEDKSHAVIADELGLPLGTVKSRLRLGLERLRATMGDDR